MLKFPWPISRHVRKKQNATDMPTEYVIYKETSLI
jgi:hypothetical protein